jgi:hypothetical protein
MPAPEPRFNPGPDHWALTSAAKAFFAAPTALEGVALEAETVLGLRGLAPEANEDERCRTAVAYQINLRAEVLEADSGGAKGSAAKGDQNIVWARDPSTGAPVTVSTAARALADALIAEYTPAPAVAADPPRAYPAGHAIEVVW